MLYAVVNLESGRFSGVKPPPHSQVASARATGLKAKPRPGTGDGTNPMSNLDNQPDPSRTEVQKGSAQDVGLQLADAKRILGRLQEILVSEQLQRYCETVRPCPRCHRRRHVKDHRRRRLEPRSCSTTA